MNAETIFIYAMLAFLAFTVYRFFAEVPTQLRRIADSMERRELHEIRGKEGRDN